MEQGRLLEAADAYQRMVNLRPGLQSYSRAAHLRWLRGNLAGARDLMRMAAGAGSARDPESIAWVYSRLALYELQAGNAKLAAIACDTASSYVSDYAPALLIRGRLLLAQGKAGEAVNALRKAHTQNPLPEYAWTYAEALRAAGRREDAFSIEEQLAREGPISDPRTFSLYLATRGKDVETALRLAEDELRARADVFTLDAVAWSLAAAGKLDQARSSIHQALAHGTLDARLFFHAGVIAAASGQKQEARRWLDKAASIRQMLLPSEREQLSKQLASL
jgi:tetratricopeptide (TPR) repeat protein